MASEIALKLALCLFVTCLFFPCVWACIALWRFVRERAGPLLQEDDLRREAQLGVKLREAADPVSTYLRGRFSAKARALLETYDGLTDVPPVLASALVTELNTVLRDPDLYKEQRFSEATVSKRTHKAIQARPSGRRLIAVNRRLIEAAYPDEISQYMSPFAEFCGNMAFLAGPLPLGLWLGSLLVAYWLASKGLSLIAIIAVVVGSLLGFLVRQLGLAWVNSAEAVPSYFIFPGRRVTGRDLGGSQVGVLSTRDAVQRGQANGDRVLQWITEGVAVRGLSETQWELHVYFSLFNRSRSLVYVYDIRCHEYSSRVGPPLLIIDRSYIVLYQDNSILSAGKVYDIPPSGTLPIDLVFRISRVPEPGYMLEVFGLFAYYHFLTGEGRAQAKVPSASIYLFQDPPTEWGAFLTAGDAWLAKQLASPAVERTKKKTLRQLRKLLKEHLTLREDL